MQAPHGFRLGEPVSEAAVGEAVPVPAGAAKTWNTSGW
ncbi:hypothetical protein BJ971_003935 [Actinoplanes digitatis]|uniref:Uncharacterized protein n=1 Tax=Actinoplanes digitatis TaxID=1868 RepID=A0A7W7HZ50_9ACTN|nr:hypothetical protein [Actinoplanes digitatis]